MRYLPVTEKDKNDMLEKINAPSSNALFHVIPDPYLLTRNLKLEETLSETDLERFVLSAASQNKDYLHHICLLGELSYYHFIPKIVKHISSYPQFYTAYTPYQPEVSQGTLEAIYEYQSYMTNITDMSVSNASLYDGATAAAETMYMICSHTKKYKVCISNLLHPHVKKVLKTYASTRNIEIIEIISSEGSVSLVDLEEKIDEKTSCFFIQSPNAFGYLEDILPISTIAKKVAAKIVHVVLEPTMFGIVKPYGEEYVDVVCGEAQSFGLEPSFGGPGLGFLTTKTEFIRKIPGRIVGKTVDSENREAYVMTLRAREQDIRRDKATSNICTNNALCALQATVFLSALGEKGLRELAIRNLQTSHYAFEKIEKETRIIIPYRKPFYNEFIVELPIDPTLFRNKMLEKGILVSNSSLTEFYPFLNNPIILTFTEMITKEQIDYFIETVKEVIE